jgi:hypothetical protein
MSGSRVTRFGFEVGSSIGVGVGTGPSTRIEVGTGGGVDDGPRVVVGR